jgi:hypothetical protein
MYILPHDGIKHNGLFAACTLDTGMKGRGVAMVHCIDDLLWQLGHGKIPKQAPASAAKAVEDYECRRREAAAAAAAQVEFEKQQHAEALRRQQLEELPKMLRRKEKALRQIMDLKAMADSGAVVLDEDQRSKLGKVDSLRQEMAEIKAQLDALTISPQPRMLRIRRLRRWLLNIILPSSRTCAGCGLLLHAAKPEGVQ